MSICSTGDLPELHSQQVQGCRLSDKKPICMCLSAFLSTLPLVNISVICKQTEFTSDYEWIHHILMEFPCWACPRSKCISTMTQCTPEYINSQQGGPSVCKGNVDRIFKDVILIWYNCWLSGAWRGGGGGVGGIRQKGQDKQQWEKQERMETKDNKLVRDGITILTLKGRDSIERERTGRGHKYTEASR